MLNLQGVTLAVKGLTPSGKITLCKFDSLSKICIFEFFFDTTECVLRMQGTHNGYGALKTIREKFEYQITMIVAAIIFIILGILIKCGKIYWLIAGYNTMLKEEKEKYNIKGIANLFGNVMFGMALIINSGYLIAKFTENSSIQNYSFWASMIIGIPYLLVKSNSKKYKLKN